MTGNPFDWRTRITLATLEKIIIDLYRWLSLQESTNFKRMNLTRVQIDTLEIIYNSGPVQMKDLARIKGITRCTLSLGINVLEKKGMVFRTPGEKDRRVFYIELTPTGRAFILGYYEFQNRTARLLTRDLTPGEQASLLRLLEKSWQSTRSTRGDVSFQRGAEDEPAVLRQDIKTP